MCECGACRGAGQLLGPSNPSQGGITCRVQTEAKTASPTLTPPGGFGCGVPTESMTASPTCEERTNGSHCPLPLVRLGQPSGRSQAVGTDQAEGVLSCARRCWVAEASPGVMRRCPAKVEPIGSYVFLWAGLVQGCLRNHSGAVRDLKIKGKQAILRIYGF